MGMENRWDMSPPLKHLLCQLQWALKKSPMGVKGGKAYTARAKKFCHGIPSEKAEYGGKGFPSQPDEEGTHWALELQEVRQQLVSGCQGRWWKQRKGVGVTPAGKRGFKCSHSWWGSGKTFDYRNDQYFAWKHIMSLILPSLSVMMAFLIMLSTLKWPSTLFLPFLSNWSIPPLNKAFPDLNQPILLSSLSKLVKLFPGNLIL